MEDSNLVIKQKKVDNERRKFESVFSKKVRAGKRRTYFFDVRKTKGEDYYLTLTESTRKFNGDGYERHKIFLYKEDFNRFLASLEDVIEYIKEELMPDYDYDEYTRRHEEYEANREQEGNANDQQKTTPAEPVAEKEEEPAEEKPADLEKDTEISSDDMEW